MKPLNYRQEGLYFLLLLSGAAMIGFFSGYRVATQLDHKLFIAFALFVLLAILGWWMANRIIDSLHQTYHNLGRVTKVTLHELNIPIATILANVEMVDSSTHDEKTKVRLQRIIKSTQSLRELYKQLDYTIKQEIMIPHKGEIDVCEVVAERLHVLEDQFGTIEVKTTLAPLKILGNTVALGRIIDNLIMNAIKYNKANGSIDITLYKNSLVIHDTGKGISPENMLHIFDQYYQVDEKTEGLGLGLSIVKNYCDQIKI